VAPPKRNTSAGWSAAVIAKPFSWGLRTLAVSTFQFIHEQGQGTKAIDSFAHLPAGKVSHDVHILRGHNSLPLGKYAVRLLWNSCCILS
jgi:hypothetical protein